MKKYFWTVGYPSNSYSHFYYGLSDTVPGHIHTSSCINVDILIYTLENKETIERMIKDSEKSEASE